MHAPTQIIIFGITGDLSQKKILPSLFSLYCEGSLPEKLSFTGFSRRDFSKSEIENFVKGVLPEHDKRDEFVSLFSYVQGDFSSLDSYVILRDHVDSVDVGFMQCSNKLYYLSVSPQYYEAIFNSLKESGLSFPCGGDLGWARILVEKPFGYNVASSQKLNHLVDTLFLPEQVYRIDHYMAKTSLQYIIHTRRDPLFAAIWNNEYIDYIEIELLEKNTVETRGEFYDSLGAVYDVVQNHILQMIALTLRTIGESEDAYAIQKSREVIFESLKLLEGSDSKRGQYAGYRTHKGVKPESETETFVEVTLTSTLPSFVGIPLRIKTGKAMDQSHTAVHVMWKNGSDLIFTTSSIESDEAYKKVLLDCMNGDQSVFTSGREVELGWKIAEEIKKAIQQKPLEMYQVGKVL